MKKTLIIRYEDGMPLAVLAAIAGKLILEHRNKYPDSKLVGFHGDHMDGHTKQTKTGTDVCVFDRLWP